MSLAEVYHQGHAQRLLQRAIDGGRLHHAYLFHGPDGVGKERFALGLAQYLLCDHPSALTTDVDLVGLESLRAGCGTCEDCCSVTAGTHPDLHLIFRQLNREHPDPTVRKRKALDIGVDVLRHFVIEKVARTPARGRAKVFVIREADRITAQAQNALLKTLEEPPGVTLLVLLVRSIDKLLPTTLSRCQPIRFDTLPTAFVRERLAALLPDLPGDQLDWYARYADGSLGTAMERAGDELHALNEAVAAELTALSSGDAAGRPDRVTKAWTEKSKGLGERYRQRDPEITDTEAGRRGLKAIFHLASAWYADVMRVGSGDAEGVVNVTLLDQLTSAARWIAPVAGIEAVKRLAQAEGHLDRNVNVQLCVETLVNDLARIDRGELVPTV